MDELRESAEQPLKDASHKEKVEMENAKIPVEIENDDLLEKIEEVINDKKSDGAGGDANDALTTADKDYLDQLDNLENNDMKGDGDKPTSTSKQTTNCDGKKDTKDDLNSKPNNLSDGVENCNLSNDLKDDNKCKQNNEMDKTKLEKENNTETKKTDVNDGEKVDAKTDKGAADANLTEDGKPSEATNEDTGKVTNKTVEQIKENSEVDFVKPPEVLDGGGEVKEKLFGITKDELVVENAVKGDVEKSSDKKETTPVVNDTQKSEKHVNEVIKENDEKMSVEDTTENPNLDVMEVDGEEKMDVDLDSELQDEEMKTVDNVGEINPKETHENAAVEKDKEKDLQNEIIEIDDKNDDDDFEEDNNKADEKDEKEIESINLDDGDSKDKIESKSDETDKVESNKNVQKTNNLPPESKDKDIDKDTVKIDDDDPDSDDDCVEIIEDDSPNEEVKESTTAKETSSNAQKKPEKKEEQANEAKKAISENIKNREQEGTKTQAHNETATANHKTDEKATEEPTTGEKVETKEESSQTTGPATSTKKESDASVSSSSEAVKKDKDDDKKSVEKSTEKQEKKSTEDNASEDKLKIESLDNLQFNGVHLSIENCTYEVTIVSDKNGFKSLSLERHDTDSDETIKTGSTEENTTKNQFVSIVGLRQFIKDFYSSVDDKSEINEPSTPAGKDSARSTNRKRTETPKAANAKSKARKRSLNVDEESEKRMKLSTPTPQPETIVEVESPKILAKWVDKTFYPGKIVETKPGNKYVVVFVDGQTKTVRKDSIIFTGDDGNLPLKDQVVHVMIDNNYEAGVVEAMEKDENNKMIYTVVTDNNTVKVPLSDICVKEDVAKTIQSRSSVSLDDTESTKSPASKRKSVRNSTEPGCSGVESTKGRRRQNRYS